MVSYGFGDMLDNNDQILFDGQVNYRIKGSCRKNPVWPSPVPFAGPGYIGTFAEAVAGPAAIAGAEVILPFSIYTC